MERNEMDKVEMGNNEIEDGRNGAKIIDLYPGRPSWNIEAMRRPYVREARVSFAGRLLDDHLEKIVLAAIVILVGMLLFSFTHKAEAAGRGVDAGQAWVMRSCAVESGNELNLWSKPYSGKIVGQFSPGAPVMFPEVFAGNPLVIAYIGDGKWLTGYLRMNECVMQQIITQQK